MNSVSDRVSSPQPPSRGETSSNGWHPPSGLAGYIITHSAILSSGDLEHRIIITKGLVYQLCSTTRH